jgi:hypothetical protein
MGVSESNKRFKVAPQRAQRNAEENKIQRLTPYINLPFCFRIYLPIVIL